MEFSREHFSVHDKIEDLFENPEAFAILSGALYAATGMKLKKSMLAMMGSKTLLELWDMMSQMGSSDDRKPPENALRIINAELGKVRKPES